MKKNDKPIINLTVNTEFNPKNKEETIRLIYEFLAEEYIESIQLEK